MKDWNKFHRTVREIMEGFSDKEEQKDISWLLTSVMGSLIDGHHSHPAFCEAAYQALLRLYGDKPFTSLPFDSNRYEPLGLLVLGCHKNYQVKAYPEKVTVP